MFSSAQGGSALYGTEPWYFYLMNGILSVFTLYFYESLGVLNFNIAFIFALPALPLCLLITHGRSNRIKSVLTLLPLYLWLGIMVPQAHKEERFLFVLYPFLCAAAAVSCSFVTQYFSFLLDKLAKRLSAIVNILIITAVAVMFITLGISRILALQVVLMRLLYLQNI